MSFDLGTSLAADQRQTLTLSQRQLQGLALLEKPLPELRAEVIAQIAANPAIEDIDNALEKPLSEVESENRKASSDTTPDYPEDDGLFGTRGLDEQAAERRQAFFDRQVKAETLQEHLMAQVPYSAIPRTDWPLVEVLVGDLDGNGRYIGSVADIQMAFGKSAGEIDALLKTIMDFDPVGCGARTPRECLLAQLDKLDGHPQQATVRRLLEDHFEDMGAGRFQAIADDLKISPEDYAAALTALRTLDAYPGRAFPNEHDRAEYIHPEVRAVRRADGWEAVTDKRSLPEIRLSKRFLDLVRRADLSEEDRAYVRERLAAARALQEAIRNRRDTLETVSQEIFDRQEAFFTEGFKALKPLTESAVAEAVGLDPSTVSRTVRGKYAATPFGTVELRRFFSSSVTNANGESVAQEVVLKTLAEEVRNEDKAHPLSDERLAAVLAAKGFALARRTVAKYRDKLGIPGAAARRR